MSNNVSYVNNGNPVWIPDGTVAATVNRNGAHYQGITILSDHLDAFSRLRVSNPTGLFDCQFTYDLQPLLFEQVTSSSDVAISHDATNRNASMTMNTAASSDFVYMQSYEWFRYQPGKSQLIIPTFCMGSDTGNFVKYAGLTDGSNGFEFQVSGSTLQFAVLSDTANGDQTVTQADWNIDKLDGTGASGITLDSSQEQILIIDFQALYVGRVRFGFDIGGNIVYAHEFLHANNTTAPYIQTANLPIRVGMRSTGTVNTSMTFNCSSVISEGGHDDVSGYSFSAEGTGTAGNDARAHILSVRPNTTFNSIANRTKFVLDSIEVLVTGNNPVKWELCIGQAISGTTTYTDVNATYSGFEYNTAGTISGTPAIVIASGYTAATAANKTATSATISNRYPITLDAAGAVRALGTLSIIATGLGATSAMRAVMNWHEVR